MVSINPIVLRGDEKGGIEVTEVEEKKGKSTVATASL